MKSLLIVWHSQTGGAKQMALAAAKAASRSGEVDVRLLHASQATATDVLTAAAYLFVTPENLGSMAGLMKDFFDRTYYDVIEQIDGRPYAKMICAGSDGAGAARQIDRIATGLRLKAVAAPLIVNTAAQTRAAILAPKNIAPDELARCEDLGEALAAGIAAGIF